MSIVVILLWLWVSVFMCLCCVQSPSVQESDGLRKETVPQSGCVGLNALVPFPRWKEGEECVRGVWAHP